MSPKSRSILNGDREDRRYTGVNDFGTIVNPMLVPEVHGGVAKGIARR